MELTNGTPSMYKYSWMCWAVRSQILLPACWELISDAPLNSILSPLQLSLLQDVVNIYVCCKSFLSLKRFVGCGTLEHVTNGCSDSCGTELFSHFIHCQGHCLSSFLALVPLIGNRKDMRQTDVSPGPAVRPLIISWKWSEMTFFKYCKFASPKRKKGDWNRRDGCLVNFVWYLFVTKASVFSCSLMKKHRNVGNIFKFKKNYDGTFYGITEQLIKTWYLWELK